MGGRQGSEPRLLILTPDFPPAHGGVQTLIYGLARAVRGFETEVLTLAAPGAGRFDDQASLATMRVRAPTRGGRSRMLALNAAAIGRAQRFRPAVTLSAHPITSPAALAIRRLLGARTVQYFYANEIRGRPRLAAFAASHADAVIAISRYTASLLAATGAQPADVRVIPPGVDVPAETGALPAARPTVLTIAQLKHPYKGHDVLARALAGVRAQLPQLEWVVIGEGPLRPGLERLARAAGLDGAARFLGGVTNSERDRWLRTAHVVAMPSRNPVGSLGGEGFGIVYLEAGAYGKPVVAGDAGGASEAVVDGVNGLLVDPGDPQAVGSAVMRLLHDRELAERLGRGGAARAREFAWPAIAERVREALLGPSPTPP